MSLILVPIVMAGCAGATIGPGAGVAQGIVKGSAEEVKQRTQTVFQQMGIQATGNSMKNAGNELQLMGKLGDADVNVTIYNAPKSTSNVEVQASKNLIEGNKNLAGEILSRIVRGS